MCLTFIGHYFRTGDVASNHHSYHVVHKYWDIWCHVFPVTANCMALSPVRAAQWIASLQIMHLWSPQRQRKISATTNPSPSPTEGKLRIQGRMFPKRNFQYLLKISKCLKKGNGKKTALCMSSCHLSICDKQIVQLLHKTQTGESAPRASGATNRNLNKICCNLIDSGNCSPLFSNRTPGSNSPFCRRVSKLLTAAYATEPRRQTW